MIRRGALSATDRIAACVLAIACVVLGTFGVALGFLHQIWAASVAALFVLALGIIYTRAAIRGRALDWPWRRTPRLHRK